ncbi:peptidyl-prolyl cis-trans isomerase G-like, partial [Trifolium medium]|nr:peptidyl-prolyl cis-trans isomerase G-like [Trifolium medium]
ELEVDPKVRTTVEKQSHEEGELSPENGEFLNNGHDTQAEFNKPTNQRTYSDDSNHNRDTSPGRSPARSPTKNSRELNQGRALLASPDHKASEPAASKHGRGNSKSPSPNDIVLHLQSSLLVHIVMGIEILEGTLIEIQATEAILSARHHDVFAAQQGAAVPGSFFLNLDHPSMQKLST